MLRLFHQVTIRRPLEEVFAFVSNAENITHWKKGLSAVRRKTPGPTGVGTIDTHVSQFMGRVDEVDHQIIEYEPGRKVAFKTLNAPFESQGYFEFEALEGATRVTIVSQADPGGVYNLLAPLIQWIGARQLRRDCAILKSVLEGDQL